MTDNEYNEYNELLEYFYKKLAENSKIPYKYFNVKYINRKKKIKKI